VGGCIVVMKEPVVVAPKFQSFSSHISSQMSQNIPVKVRDEHSVGGTNSVDNPLHVENNNKHALC
jgi:hypothetical protein